MFPNRSAGWTQGLVPRASDRSADERVRREEIDEPFRAGRAPDAEVRPPVPVIVCRNGLVPVGAPLIRPERARGEIEYPPDPRRRPPDREVGPAVAVVVPWNRDVRRDAP